MSTTRAAVLVLAAVALVPLLVVAVLAGTDPGQRLVWDVIDVAEDA